MPSTPLGHHTRVLSGQQRSTSGLRLAPLDLGARSGSEALASPQSAATPRGAQAARDSTGKSPRHARTRRSLQLSGTGVSERVGGRERSVHVEALPAPAAPSVSVAERTAFTVGPLGGILLPATRQAGSYVALDLQYRYDVVAMLAGEDRRQRLAERHRRKLAMVTRAVGEAVGAMAAEAAAAFAARALSRREEAAAEARRREVMEFERAAVELLVVRVLKAVGLRGANPQGPSAYVWVSTEGQPRGARGPTQAPGAGKERRRSSWFGGKRATDDSSTSRPSLSSPPLPETLGGQGMTEVEHVTSNPVWDETFTLPVSRIGARVLDVEVVDEALRGHGNDLLGKVRLGVATLPVGVPKREWFALQSMGSLDDKVPMEMTVAVLQARNLASTDRGGTSDPYVTLELGEQRFKTSVQPQTLSPNWQELFKLDLGDMLLPSQEERSHGQRLWQRAKQRTGVDSMAMATGSAWAGKLLTVKVWDHDLGFGQDDFLGQVLLPIVALQPGDKHEEWFELRARPEDSNETALKEVSGEVQLRVVIREKKRGLAVKRQVTQLPQMKGAGRVLLEALRLRELPPPVASTLAIHLVKAELFSSPDAESEEPPSALAQVCVEGRKSATKLIKASAVPRWNEWFGFALLRATSQVAFRVFHCPAGIDDPKMLIGNASASIADLEVGERTEQWYPLKSVGGEDAGRILAKIHRKPVVAEVFELFVEVLAAAELVASDSGGTSDPFATLSVLEQGGLSTRRTATLKKTLHPEWNAAFVFEVEDLYEPLEVKIFDQDLLGANDFLGQALVVLEDIPMEQTLDRWFPLQPESDDGQEVTGSVHLRICPRTKRKDDTWISIELHEARGLLAADKRGTSDPYVVVSLRSKGGVPVQPSKSRRPSIFSAAGPDHLYKTKVIKNTVAPVWNEKCTFKVAGDAVVAVEVMDHNMLEKHVFLGEVLLDLQSVDKEVTKDEWVVLRGKAGLLGKVTGELHLTVRKEVKPLEQLAIKKRSLTLAVHSARGLMAMDRGGTSDPFVVVSFPGLKHRKTAVQYKTLNPTWNETFVFELPFPTSNDKDGPPVEWGIDDEREVCLELYDYDIVGSNDFLGRAAFRLGEMEVGVPVDEWVVLEGRKGKNETVRGDLHVEFVLTEG